MTEFELFQSLRPHYPSREYALIPQVANGTGAGAFRHCDALVLSLWPSRGIHLSGFEIKTHRGDWMRELRNPEKAEEIAQYCNYWWIVASGPFVKADELPQPWGLMTWDQRKHELLKTKSAPFREALKPDLPFLAAALRKAQEVVTPAAALQEARYEGLEKGREESAEKCKHDLEEFANLQRRVKAFEKASGISIVGWNSAENIGEVVKQVLNGTVERDREKLLSIATRLVHDLGVTDDSTH